MPADSWHYKLFHFKLLFWVWELWKGRKKIEYPDNKKSFLDEIKSIFTDLKGCHFEKRKKKKKKKKKKSGHKLYSKDYTTFFGSSQEAFCYLTIVRLLNAAFAVANSHLLLIK